MGKFMIAGLAAATVGLGAAAVIVLPRPQADSPVCECQQVATADKREEKERFSAESVERDIARCVARLGRESPRSAVDLVEFCRRYTLVECVGGRDDWKDCYRWLGEPVPEYLPKP